MVPVDTYEPADDRYDSMEYRFCGRSGLKLPALSLGLWQNFGDDRPEDVQRAILRRAFDRGVTHFDLANNYGPPYGRAEESFGRYLREDFAGLRRQGGGTGQERVTPTGRDLELESWKKCADNGHEHMFAPSSSRWRGRLQG